MKTHFAIKTTVLPMMACALLAACGPGDSGSESADVTPATKIEPSSNTVDTESAAETGSSELAVTSWQLVKISSMDDSEFLPADSSTYSLTFGSDGSVSIKADCNNAKGGWSSEGQGQLAFTELASTRALCPPESISDKYLGQFQWVRTYVLKDGHLFLATMADGSIIEFAPAQEG